MRKFLNEKELNTIRKQTSRLSGAQMLSPDASLLDRTKYHLCKLLLVYMRENSLSQRQLAKRLGVVESRISEITHYRIKKISLDRLVKYHETLNPKFSIRVA